MVGDAYTIADMAVFPWYGELVIGKLYEAQEFLEASSYKNVARWANEMAERPAVKRGQRVNRVWGPEDQRVPERHSAEDVK
jgi:GST-like protein